MENCFHDPWAFSQRLNRATKEEFCEIIEYSFNRATEAEKEKLFLCANRLRQTYYGNKVYFRGLIEFSSVCKNDCYYCGLQKSNEKAVRYRLSTEEILDCCQKGYGMGFRTFVLQSGEDGYFTDERLCALIDKIKTDHPGSAVTLSIGERSRDSYQRLYDAGADRYLLRHETANEAHYQKLPPKELSLKNRMRCLYDLKDIGYQVGAGFMVSSPFQTVETLSEDLLFLRALDPQMVGIGPFIPHKDTRFAGFCTPSPDQTLIMLSLVRILLPKVLLPATTALVTADPQARKKGLLAGANVIMPNLSPSLHRRDYALYDNKACDGEEGAEGLAALAEDIKSMGFTPDFSRGDHVDWQKEER